MQAHTENISQVLEFLESRFLLSGTADLAHTFASLSRPEYLAVSATIGSKAYFIGGHNSYGDSETYSSAVDVYDFPTGQWTTRGIGTFGATGYSATLANKIVSAGNPGYSIYNADTGTIAVLKIPSSVITSVLVRVGDRLLLAGEDTARLFKNVAYISDKTAERWYPVKVPLKFVDGPAVRVGTKIIVAGSNFYYELRTGKWIRFTGIDSTFGYGSATTVGTKALFTNSSGEVSIFDDLTGQWTVTRLSQQRYLPAATTVGTKAIFAGGDRGTLPTPDSDVVDVYDAATNLWSTTTLASARHYISVTTVGNQAIFAGGASFDHPRILAADNLATSAVDIFTDTAPAAVLSAGLTGRPGHTVTVQLFNTGDAPLASNAGVKIYATHARGIIDGSSTLLGSNSTTSPLAASDNRTLRIPTKIPSTLASGRYYLVAAVDDGRTVTPVASADSPFKVTAKATPAVRHAIAGAFTRLFRR